VPLPVIKHCPSALKGNGVNGSGMIDAQEFFARFHLDEFSDALTVG